MHVGDLDGSRSTKKNGWQAAVTISVHQADHSRLARAVVIGDWAGGYSGTSSCTTNGKGQCSVSSGIIAGTAGSATFAVRNVTYGSLAYYQGCNHDPEGDSNNGTTITISSP